MAIHNNNIVDIDLNSGTIFRSFLSRSLGEGDGEFNRFGVRAFRNGQPVNLTGCQVIGQFVRPIGDTIELEPVGANGNEAAVTLKKACYAYEGAFQLTIKIQGLDFEGTVRIVDGMIVKTTTGNIIDPGSVIPDLSSYGTAVEAAEAAAAAITQYKVKAVLVSGDNYDIQVTVPVEES